MTRQIGNSLLQLGFLSGSPFWGAEDEHWIFFFFALLCGVICMCCVGLFSLSFRGGDGKTPSPALRWLLLARPIAHSGAGGCKPTNKRSVDQPRRYNKYRSPGREKIKCFNLIWSMLINASNSFVLVQANCSLAWKKKIHPTQK